MAAPRIPEELAGEIGDLGAPISEIRAGRIRIILIGGAGIAVFLFGVGLLALFFAPDEFLFTLMGSTTPVEIHIPALLPAACIGVGAVAFCVALRMRGLRIIVCTKGLVRLHRTVTTALFWDEIHTVRRTARSAKEMEKAQMMGKPVLAAIELTLLGPEGVEFHFDETAIGQRKLRQLRQLVEEYTLPHLLRPVLDAIENREAVSFGVIGVSREGLWYGDALLPWAQLKSIEVAKGRVKVTVEGQAYPFCDVEIEKVPNCHVLLAVAERARTGHMQP